MEGSLFKPKRLGVFYQLTPIRQVRAKELVEYHYSTEGDFKNPEEFKAWLRKNGLYNRFMQNPNRLGWLMAVMKIDG